MSDVPKVSVVVATYNAHQFLEPAIRSALDQTLADIEVIVVDDCSSDDSIAIAERIAAQDPRVRVARMDANGGPGAARNRGFAMARGEWIAVLDSDDLFHPERLARLLAEAEAQGADLIADDLILFDEANITRPHRFLDRARRKAPSWIGLEDYCAETVMYGPRPNLGFLKPLFRRAILPTPAYDARLRIAEDDDLILRLLLDGHRYRLLPEPLYFYRKHGSSISHRLSARNVDAMAAVADEHRAAIAARGRSPAFRRRYRALLGAQAYTHFLDALKARTPGKALGIVARQPRAAGLFHQPITARLRRLADRFRRERPLPTGRNAVIVTRQRIVGPTNGSSTYLLDLARAVREAGLTPHLLQPSPATFGRVPLLRMRPELDVFATHRIRGAVKIGNTFYAKDPAIWAKAATAVARRFARKAGLRGAWTVDKRMPHTIAAPWSPSDYLYLLHHGRPIADVAIADYIFHVAALPYLARPEAPSAIVMHDLYHARAKTFTGTQGADSIGLIGEEEERALFARADAVIAIQSDEAAYLSRAVPEVEAILAPMAADPVVAPQPGDGRRLLFVGSNTTPNVDGLAWFFAEIWPRARAALPDLRLHVAGSVAAAFGGAGTDGVRFLGLVDDLAAEYTAAGVVISPLRQGSGLKIKLIEALAHGKALVGTSVTLQGVEDLAPEAVVRADSAEDFAGAIVDLARDEAGRAALAGRALSAARARFSREASYRPFREWLAGAA